MQLSDLSGPSGIKAWTMTSLSLRTCSLLLNLRRYGHEIKDLVETMLRGKSSQCTLLQVVSRREKRCAALEVLILDISARAHKAT